MLREPVQLGVFSWTPNGQNGMMAEKLKTVIIPAVPNASVKLAAQLKSRLGWLNEVEEIQAILGRGSHTRVVEHLRAEYVDSVTSVLESLGLGYEVYDDGQMPDLY